MTMKEQLTKALKHLQGSDDRMTALERRPLSAEYNQRIFRDGIDIKIVDGVIEIECPKGTKLIARCWYDGVSQMTEEIEIGSDDSAGIIRMAQGLRSRISDLERRFE